MKDSVGDLPAYFPAPSVMQTLYQAVVMNGELKDKAPNLPVNLCSYTHLCLLDVAWEQTDKVIDTKGETLLLYFWIVFQWYSTKLSYPEGAQSNVVTPSLT